MSVVNEEIGTRGEARDSEAVVQAARERLGHAEFLATWERGSLMTLDEVFDEAFNATE